MTSRSDFKSQHIAHSQILLRRESCCEAIPRQVNFLVDESVLTGKGANSTISLVHYYFGKVGLGETDAYIHADNCSGQNKMPAWRIIVGWSVFISGCWPH